MSSLKNTKSEAAKLLFTLFRFVTTGSVVQVARHLGIDDTGISGGEAVERAARLALHPIRLVVPMTATRDCNFSFSGLKTQVKYVPVAASYFLPPHETWALIHVLLLSHFPQEAGRRVCHVIRQGMANQNAKTFVFTGIGIDDVL